MDLYTAAEEEYRHKAARRAQLFKTLKGLAVAAVFLFPFVLYYKSVAASNGFCDAGRTTNDVIEGREQPIARAQSCLVRRAEWKLDNDTEPPFQCDASVLPLFSFFPRSTSCTPCPDAAICAHGEVTRCVSDKDILTPHLLAPLGPLVDGWPFLPTRVFAPHCRRDMARMRRVGGLAVEIEAELARARGEAICHGTNYTGDAEGALCDSFATRRVVSSQKNRIVLTLQATISRDQFNELFDAALQYLVENGDVEKTTAADDEPTLTTDTDRYTATRIEYSLACSIQLKVQSLLGRAGVTVLNLLARFRWHLIALGATLLAVTWGKYKHKRERSDDEQAKDVRNLALRMLETQEMRHYTDPVTTPHPFIRPAQVRDILLSEKSPSARKRIWARVETQVEQNANVRVAEREVDGDSWKTWEWIGPTRRKGDD
jgi:Tfp pilus assembly protein FimT